MGAFMLDELRIALQRIDYLNGTVPGLRSWVDDDFGPAINDKCPRLLAGFLNRIEPPILCLKDQDPSARMNQNEVRVCLFWPNRNVVPKFVVVIELLHESLSQLPLTLRHSPSACSYRGN